MSSAIEKYEAVIGLEIHVQLDTKSKMFCRCDNNSENAEPNTNVCPVCMGYPGVLPVTNAQAIDWGIKTAIALGCSINPMQIFDRKNYFYPDLPKGYQISQFFYPVGEKGNLKVDYLAEDRKTKKEFAVGITRIHLEEDAGKLVHAKDATLVDLNRCGTPLMEIVTEPDIKSPEEAKAFLQELQRVVRSLGVSRADMEKGHLRVDANVSVRPLGQDAFGTKVEVKNMNSFRFMEQALQYEIGRQVELLEKGERIEMETRGWDEKSNTTISQRSKEGSVDYRYFPEPDLPSIYIEKEKIDEIGDDLPLLPSALRLRAEEFGLPYDRIIELQDLGKLKEIIGHVENIEGVKGSEALAKVDIVKLANMLVRGIDFKNSRRVLDFFVVVEDKGLSSTSADKLSLLMKEHPEKTPAELVGELKSLSEEDLEKIVKQVIDDNPEIVDKVKAGDERVKGFLMGQIMAKSKGEAEPALAKDILNRLLTL